MYRELIEKNYESDRTSQEWSTEGSYGFMQKQI